MALTDIAMRIAARFAQMPDVEAVAIGGSQASGAASENSDIDIETNWPLLRTAFPAYLHQLEKAAARRDLVSLNHRAAALLASYFDIVFAVNRLPHPGEKRLIDLAERHCARLPVNMRADIEAFLRATVDSALSTSDAGNALIDHLDALLIQDGLIPTAGE